MREHLLKTTHGAQTRMGCEKVSSRHDHSEGNGAGGEGGGCCNCVDATELEVKSAVERALESFDLTAGITS